MTTAVIRGNGCAILAEGHLDPSGEFVPMLVTGVTVNRQHLIEHIRSTVLEAHPEIPSIPDEVILSAIRVWTSLGGYLEKGSPAQHIGTVLGKLRGSLEEEYLDFSIRAQDFLWVLAKTPGKFGIDASLRLQWNASKMDLQMTQLHIIPITTAGSQTTCTDTESPHK